MNETLDFQFTIDFKQEMVRSWKSYFKTETTNKEFEAEYKDSLAKKLLKSLNKELASGLRLPHGHMRKPIPFNRLPTMSLKDQMIVVV